MPVSFQGLIEGEEYDRNGLAAPWGYRGWQALGRGIVAPANENKIVLFVTYGNQATLTQYQDHFVGDQLHMEGETNHLNNRRLIETGSRGEEVHLFYRNRHHQGFTYFGRVTLAHVELNQDSSSKFVFDTGRIEGLTANSPPVENRGRDGGDGRPAGMTGRPGRRDGGA